MSKIQETKPKENIFTKISAIQAELGTIAKNGRNSFQKYDYVKAADIVKELDPLFIKHGVVMIVNSAAPFVMEAGKGMLTTYQMQVKLINKEDPEDFTTVMTIAQGHDNGDKGAYKAQTGGLKYALMSTFMISSDDDPENDSKSVRPVKSTKKTASDF